MLETLVGAGAGEVDEYRLVRSLDPGDGGPTFLAHDRLLDRAVVLRMLEADAAGPPAHALAAARALARVSHPSLCAVHRVRGGADRPYVVSSYVRGMRLDQVPRPMPAAALLDLARALAGALATLHGAEVSCGDVRAERVIVAADGIPRLTGLRGARPNAEPTAMRADVRDLLDLLVGLAAEPLQGRLAGIAAAESLPPTAEELLGVLEGLANPTLAQETIDRFPYRGLRPFGVEHAGLFFGRAGETADARLRLAGAPWLLVAGRSGSGKTSFVQAGLVVALRNSGLDDRRAWEVALVAPGARPIDALAGAIASRVGQDPASLGAQLRADPARASALAKRDGSGLIVVVDPLDEVWTVASDAERSMFFAAIERFGVVTPGLRLVLAMRSDLLDRLGDLGELGRDLLRSTLLLPPLGKAALRETIAAPARTLGVQVDDAVVEALVDEAGDGESLPMLSFAMSELWQHRDRQRRAITLDSLAAIGSASAALARHGDLVLASLAEDERAAARRLLVTLTTRERCTRTELVGADASVDARALDGLVRGRLVAAGETYRLAHVSIARVWPRLRAWLDETSDARMTAARLRAAAGDWDRGGRRDDALWSDRQVRELEGTAALDRADDVCLAFVVRSRRVGRLARLRRWGAATVVTVGAAAVALAVFGARARQERRAEDDFVGARLADADRAAADAEALDVRVIAVRQDAFGRYDAGDWKEADARWHEARDLARREAERFAAALDDANLALGRAPDARAARARAAELSLRWLRVAEREGQAPLIAELRAGIARLDDGPISARVDAPGRLRLTTSVPGARLTLRAIRAIEKGRLTEDAPEPVDPGAWRSLAPGSYVVEGVAPGRAATRLPLWIQRDGLLDLELPWVRSDAVPQGFVFVPGGVSRLGAPDGDAVRQGLTAQPEHPVSVGPFLAAVHEVTFGDYRAFLAALPAAERERRRPRGSGVELTRGPDGSDSLTLGGITARAGEPFCRPRRDVRRCQDWLRFPVLGLSWEDASAYAAWVSATGLPGARLCTEREWERAARGADGRPFPAGLELRPGDANFIGTYAADAERMGPDEVGSFPADVSPFGVDDMAGNASEWVAGSLRADRPDERVARGGAWSDEIASARAESREVSPDRRRVDNLGTRLCLDVPERSAR